MTECKHRWEQVWDGAYSCTRCKGYIYTNKIETLTYHGGGLALADFKPNYMITFHDKDHKKVGSFDFNDGRMVFEGDVNESGQVFVDWACNAFKQRIDDAVKAEREACAKLADEWVCAYPHPSTFIAESIRARGLV